MKLEDPEDATGSGATGPSLGREEQRVAHDDDEELPIDEATMAEFPSRSPPLCAPFLLPEPESSGHHPLSVPRVSENGGGSGRPAVHLQLEEPQPSESEVASVPTPAAGNHDDSAKQTEATLASLHSIEEEMHRVCHRMQDLEVQFHQHERASTSTGSSAPQQEDPSRQQPAPTNLGELSVKGTEEVSIPTALKHSSEDKADSKKTPPAAAISPTAVLSKEDEVLDLLQRQEQDLLREITEMKRHRKRQKKKFEEYQRYAKATKRQWKAFEKEHIDEDRTRLLVRMEDLAHQFVRKEGEQSAVVVSVTTPPRSSVTTPPRSSVRDNTASSSTCMGGHPYLGRTPESIVVSPVPTPLSTWSGMASDVRSSSRVRSPPSNLQKNKGNSAGTGRSRPRPVVRERMSPERPLPTSRPRPSFYAEFLGAQRRPE